MTPSRNSLAVIYWLLCRMVLEMRGTITAENPWDVLPDMFLYR
jgi:small subunit ribosomal protein SAe